MSYEVDQDPGWRWLNEVIDEVALHTQTHTNIHFFAERALACSACCPHTVLFFDLFDLFV